MTDYDIVADSAAIYLDASALPKIDIEDDNASGLTRCLVYLSRIPVFCSLVGFGEFISVAGRKSTQKRIGTSGYLYSCRALLVDLEIGKIQRIEPVAERSEFIRSADPLLAKYSALGGGDVWHLLAAQHLAAQRPPATVLSFDQDLVNAARSENLRAVYGHGLDREILIRALEARGKWVPA